MSAPGGTQSLAGNPGAEKNQVKSGKEKNDKPTVPAAVNPAVRLSQRQHQAMWLEHENELSVTECTICPNEITER